MRLATVSHEGRSCAARLEDGAAALLDAEDVGALLAMPGGIDAARSAAASATVPQGSVVISKLIPRPAKVREIIFTGTPAGVGQVMVPPVFLQEGQTVTSSIEGLGELVNTCRAW